MLDQHLNKVFILLVVIYVTSMFIFPLTQDFSWLYLLSVWNHWQGFNVGVLALLTSLMAFKITKYREEEQRKRNFIAARAFLPLVLSQLCDYCDNSATVLVEAYRRIRDQGRANCNEPLHNNVQELDSGYKQVFRDCIRFAEPEFAKYLSNILVRLQVHHSRIIDLKEEFLPHKRMVNNVTNVKSYIQRLGELRGLLNHIFEFARGEEEFEFDGLNWDVLRNAYGNLNIPVDEIAGLEEDTRRSLIN